MKLMLLATLFVCIGVAMARPTVYKVNENSKLEPDLVAVSSTVIPLPVYQVGFGIGVSNFGKSDKRGEPGKLITVKKSSSVKQVSKEEFNKQP